MKLLCLDLEGVLNPEISLGVADRTGIEALRLTTRDIADYDELMQGRLAVLEAHGLTMRDVQAVIQEMNPLPGAVEFMRWARQTFQVAILSDTFYEFATPLMAKLDQPFFALPSP
jgi:phosphoserine/homoserine phosphotransferase